MTQSNINCPGCDSRHQHLFYRATKIPVHCNLLLESREQALNQSRGDLELTCCEDCGFIYNRVFDESKLSYGREYEGSQGASATFHQFARSLAMRWIERYGVRNKTILELGCGGGEFLELICDLGDNRGIGIDPACTKPSTGRIRYIADWYGPKYADLHADLICCRHTLEHIPQTRQFLSTIRQTLGELRQIVVAFELPDTRRILTEGAYWDVYYEHCSYFTAGSLARLFRGCGFDLLHLERDYEDQYLVLGGRPGTGQGPVDLFPIEEPPDQTVAAAMKFADTVDDKCRLWRERLNQWHDRRIALWGSGSKGVGFLTTLGLDDEQIRYVVDINPRKQGRYMAVTGQRIIAPAELATFQPDVVIVMNPIYESEIRAEMQRQVVNAQVYCVQ